MHKVKLYAIAIKVKDNELVVIGLMSALETQLQPLMLLLLPALGACRIKSYVFSL